MKRIELLFDGIARDLQTDGTSVVVDGREAQAEVCNLGSDRFSVLLDGRQHAVRITRSNDGLMEAWVGGSRHLIEVQDPRQLSRRKNVSAASGSGEVQMPMPGKVLAVHVANGDRVEQGQSLVIVEAMKMQNQLRAPRDGIVSGLQVKPGDAAPAGATLAVIE